MIDHINLSRLDLNLLVALDALLTERHVTRAAQRIGLGQSAMSHNLARLRVIFEDELLTRGAAGLQPTPKALAVAPRVRDTLQHVQEVMLPANVFEPSSSDRVFRIGISDGMEISLLPTLVGELCRSAPGIGIEIRKAEPGRELALLDDDALDLCVGVLPDGASHHQQRVLCTRQSFLCLFDTPQVGFDTPISLDDLVAVPHVVAASDRESIRVIDEALARQGLFRRIKLTTPHALAIPYALRQAPLLAIMPQHTVSACVERFGLACSPVPLALPNQQILMAWHESYDDDPGHGWFRNLLFRSAKRLAPA